MRSLLFPPLLWCKAALTLLFLWGPSVAANEDSANPYAAIDQIFVQHCLDCHSHDDPDANLNLESYDQLIRGGQNGSPIIEGDSKKSPLIRLVHGFTGPNNKTRIMPPGRREKLTKTQIKTLEEWIDQGAPPPPEGWRRTLRPEYPKIPVVGRATEPIHSIAYSPQPRQLAIGRYQRIDLLDPETQAIAGSLTGHRGNVNGLAFSPDGKRLFSAAGEVGVAGEIIAWDTQTRERIYTVEGHYDSIYSLALSEDGSLLATGSYDQTIHLWQAADGTLLRSLKGHQGAIFGLAFRPDNQVLASASADRTIKLWDVRKGTRLDTLSQPLKAQHAVIFSPDGKTLYAGGVDQRIRVWRISPSAAETTNPILETRFAHEGTILTLAFSADAQRLASSADDRRVKVWAADRLEEQFALTPQSDWSAAVEFIAQDNQFVVGRLDGSVGFFQSADGKEVSPPQPEIARVFPAGIQPGAVSRIRIEGKALSGVASVQFNPPTIEAAIAPAPSASGSHLDLLIYCPSDVSSGTAELTLTHPTGKSNSATLHIDPLQQETEASLADQGQRLMQLPVNLWGRITESGETDTFSFDAQSGQGLVFDVAANRLGSKANVMITLARADGVPLASSQQFGKSIDPLLHYVFEENGRYQISVEEQFLKASPDHFYRISIGAFPYVTDLLPRFGNRNQTLPIELIGYNLGDRNRVEVATGDQDKQEISLDPTQYRYRSLPPIHLKDWAMGSETEPNDGPHQASPIEVGQTVSARIWQPTDSGGDVDHYRFTAIQGQSLVIETFGDSLGTSIDTRIQILRPDGQPIERLLLEAIRATSITFRPISSTAGGARLENWEEMSLNDYLFMNGEVVKLFLAPRGPDSSWDFYPAAGTRRTYFDTSTTAHANFEACYIVHPHPPGTPLPDNGLPRFPLYYENDDHSEAAKGRDSRVYFTAPESGDYLIRVIDTRHQTSPRFIYQLVLREQRPDFDVRLSNLNPTINRGSGRAFDVNRTRVDGFDGEIEVEITGLPKGVTVSSPLVIQAGHHKATGTLHLNESVEAISSLESLAIDVVASAKVGSETRIKSIPNFGKIKVGDAPKLYVTLDPSPRAPAVVATSLSESTVPPTASEFGDISDLPVISIEPGSTIPAQISVQRNGHTERITFSVANLPHGVIVDNIGLNGVLMPPDVSEREIFFTAAPWVKPTQRLCHARASEAGGQTSRPVLFRVVAPGTLSQAQ